MTRTTNARIAGFTFLFYIAAGVGSMILFGRATGGEGMTASLAGIAQHATDVRIAILLTLLTCFAALVLAVTLYAITREQDPDLAMLALVCRLAEGVLNASIGVLATVGLLWLATNTGPNTADPAAAQALGAFLFKMQGWNPIIAATFFAVGSTLFSWLLLRGRMVPLALAGLGVVASVLLVVVLPVQLAGFLGGPITRLVWLPMLVFEVTLALWLLIKGVGIPGRKQSA
jgi:hypothetical protein